MGVRILKDEESQQAALYCSTSGWAFGPVFDGPEAAEQAEAFAQWFADGEAYHAGTECGIKPGIYADDPRGYSETDLECLFGVWKSRYLNEDGHLKEVVSDGSLAL